MKKTARILLLAMLISIISGLFAFQVFADEYGYVPAAANKIMELQKTYPNGGHWSGDGQCKGFANKIYKEMFGLDLPRYTEQKNVLEHTAAVKVVKEILQYPTVDELKEMFKQGRTGDIIQGRKTSLQHTMVFIYADDNGVCVYDANSDGNNTIKQHTLTYNDIANGGPTNGNPYRYGISLYTAPNYEEKFGASVTPTPEPLPEKYLFDPEYYASMYDDVKATYGTDERALYNHWLTYGKAEGRSPSPLFDPKYYLEKNPDVKNAYGTDYSKAYDHWVTYGIYEYRKCSPIFDTA